MESSIIGRNAEQGILDKALRSEESEMIAVIGRRRVGKTFLIREVYKEYLVFEMTGSQNAPLGEQLVNFAQEISRRAKSPLPIKPPPSWSDAFFVLRSHLEQSAKKKKRVVFFDELPWLAGHRSGFLRAFDHFWNSWAVKQNLIIIICGSAASWMIKNLINAKGGLYNRITRHIYLKPFTLLETETYLHSRKINLNRYQIIQLYMAMGGIPHYLKEVERGKSAIQNIDHICFSKSGLLKDEFSRLYPALFFKAENHITIVRIMAKSYQGLTRNQIIDLSRLAQGGGTSRVLIELEQSGFITSYQPFGKRKKDKLYRLTDEYSLFYLKFIEKHNQAGTNIWQHLSQTQTFKSWSGYAFENICLNHAEPIKTALGISGIYSSSSSFYKKTTNDEKGIQIDLLIDRNDGVINLFEIKFYNTELSLSENDANRLRGMLRIFQESTGTRKYIILTYLTTFGIKPNKHSIGLVEKELTLDDLFNIN